MALPRSACTLPSSSALTDSVCLLSSRSDEDALSRRLASTAGSTCLVINRASVSVINYKSAISISARLVKLNSLPSILCGLRGALSLVSRLLGLVLRALRNGAFVLVLAKA